MLLIRGPSILSKQASNVSKFYLNLLSFNILFELKIFYKFRHLMEEFKFENISWACLECLTLLWPIALNAIGSVPCLSFPISQFIYESRLALTNYYLTPCIFDLLSFLKCFRLCSFIRQSPKCGAFLQEEILSALNWISQWLPTPPSPTPHHIMTAVLMCRPLPKWTVWP